ncbi:uncharacterized protein LOC126811836 isoform X1 [Patella vulgata]|uniref:uncharacterized protein LOC126811836 isoform X1 n=1 Tax=Patella vulgata TaxID=6465 RepID=UPI002180249B|nr:uncharacterized protein LOC126811836 isoform X1 [Patella vulgata]
MKQPPDPPKIRNPPPKIRTLPKMKLSKRRRKPAEAPVSAQGLKEIQDPLDFLAKYCIINPVRLPFYELIFEAAVLENKPEFPVPYLPQVNDDEPPVNHASHQQQSSLSQHEKTMIKDMTLVSHGLQPPLVGYSVPEQCLEKMSFTMQTLHGKKEEMEKKLMNLEAKRINMLAELAREEFPGIDGMIYSPRKKKGKQKKPEPTSPEQDGEITDETIIERLDKKSLAQLCSKDDIRHVDIEIERIHQKMKDVTFRQNQLKDERNMLLGYCEDDFVNRQFTERHSKDFRRQQSELYNTLRPTPDYEITLDNLRESLQQVNNHLLTDKECEFIYQVLDLPGRERINFRLFSVVAALSEKVTQLDPMIRRLMNKHDYKALDIKMEKCRELFSFLEDDIAPPGEATATSLALELTAGGLTPEHTSYVLGKFNREGRGLIDFMDFVTYIPLFVEIHQRIIKDPLSEDQDL